MKIVAVKHGNGKTRTCPYCGGKGPRVIVGTGRKGLVIYAHRRCIGPAK